MILVTGLPRSGTAWMAEFLGIAHEAIPEFEWNDYIEWQKENGNSDSGALIFLDIIRKRIPDLKVLMIRRNPDDVKKSLKRIGLPYHNIDRMAEFLDQDADMVIDYPDFIDPEVARKIWEEFAEGEFDEERHRKLTNMRITADEDKIMKKAFSFYERNK